ncbi:MAG: hypothetical protein IPJ61_21380 [Tessaracoccus sp.]|uniref:hypothetical protein n=1 Tax=Tessaracoccus sp. TaxID=1971211 RepID=UPI001EBE30F0|nr:hypothetical protein [Tessaracoccus sp.]MBK7823541.1 hypothetical protein [Tessaracoccus sp.]
MRAAVLIDLVGDAGRRGDDPIDQVELPRTLSPVVATVLGRLHQRAGLRRRRLEVAEDRLTRASAPPDSADVGRDRVDPRHRLVGAIEDVLTVCDSCCTRLSTRLATDAIGPLTSRRMSSTGPDRTAAPRRRWAGSGRCGGSRASGVRSTDDPDDLNAVLQPGGWR